MLNKTAVRLAKKLLSLQIITEEVFDIYVYGLELLLSFFFSSSVIVIIGTILGRVIETLVFLLVFVLLRSFTGGRNRVMEALKRLRVNYVTVDSPAGARQLANINTSQDYENLMKP